MTQRYEPTFGAMKNSDLEVNANRRPRFDPNNRPRKPWLALLLGVVFGPAGFLYVGSLLLGVAIYTSELVMMWLFSVTGWVYNARGTLAVYAGVLLLQLIVMFLPWWLAKQRSERFLPRWYNRWFWYPLLVGAIVIPFGYITLNRAAIFHFDVFRVPTASMQPTVFPGEFIVTDSRAQSLAEIRAGDVVVYHPINNADKLYLRRVIALPGQHLRIGAAGATIDGHPESPSAAHYEGLSVGLTRYSDVTLGPDQFFLMGDDRDLSTDSRTEGPYARTSLAGKVTAIWWSSDRGRIGAVH